MKKILLLGLFVFLASCGGSSEVASEADFISEIESKGYVSAKFITDNFRALMENDSMKNLPDLETLFVEYTPGVVRLSMPACEYIVVDDFVTPATQIDEGTVQLANRTGDLSVNAIGTFTFPGGASQGPSFFLEFDDFVSTASYTVPTINHMKYHSYNRINYVENGAGNYEISSFSLDDSQLMFVTDSSFEFSYRQGNEVTYIFCAR